MRKKKTGDSPGGVAVAIFAPAPIPCEASKRTGTLRLPLCKHITMHLGLHPCLRRNAKRGSAPRCPSTRKLHLICWRRCRVAMWLLHGSSSGTAQDQDGATSLHTRMFRSRLDAAQFLVESTRLRVVHRTDDLRRCAAHDFHLLFLWLHIYEERRKRNGFFLAKAGSCGEYFLTSSSPPPHGSASARLAGGSVYVSGRSTRRRAVQRASRWRRRFVWRWSAVSSSMRKASYASEGRLTTGLGSQI